MQIPWKADSSLVGQQTVFVETSINFTFEVPYISSIKEKKIILILHL